MDSRELRLEDLTELEKFVPHRSREMDLAACGKSGLLGRHDYQPCLVQQSRNAPRCPDRIMLLPLAQMAETPPY